MKKLIVLRYTLLLLTLAAVCALPALAEISVDATLSHHSYPLDRAARLTIAISGTSRNAAITLPDIKNIRLHSRGQASQINMVNGSITSSITHNYLVQALKPGSYTIPPIQVTAAGETVSTKPIAFEVTGPGQSSKAEKRSEVKLEDIAFIKLSEIGEYYPGEIVPVTLKVYLSREYKTDISTLPSLSGDGVVMEQLSSEPQQSQETYQGKSFHVITWQTSLSGIKTGSHPISFSLDATLLIPQKRRSRSPFSSFGGSLFDDSMFEDFFGNYERRPITVKSSDLVFTVLPLPAENRPEGFTGAIGDFDMTVSAKPTEIEVGEPITLNTTISGSGNFDRVEAPVFPEGNSWKTYSPTANFESGAGAAGGKKTFEQAVVVKSGGVHEVPPLQFSYFDPSKKKYITKSSSPILLSVKAGKVQPLAVAVAPQTRQQLPSEKVETSERIQGLSPLHLDLGEFSRRPQTLPQKTWYLVSCMTLLLISLSALIVKYRQQRHRNNPEIQLNKNRRSQLQRDLDATEQAMKARDPARFLLLCRTAIQNQFAKLCEVEPSAISLADIHGKMEPGSSLLKTFSLAEQAAYGGATLSSDDMGKLFILLKKDLEGLSC
ncbi:MAG: protein BatD [Desulfobulbaceae bacterium]|nr:protein BatD [Desulfobulbaceae bacterium]